MTETRILHFTTKMVVEFREHGRKDGIKTKDDYEPSPRPISKPQSKDIFKTTTEEWKTLMYDAMYKKYYDAAKAEAEGMGTEAILKSFDMYDVWVEVIVEPEIPVSKEIIEAIKGYEKSAKVLIEATGRFKALTDLVEDFIKRASVLNQKGMDLRIKYNLVGKNL